jgi:hypothetical protein
MKYMIDKQQAQISLELKLQAVAKNALIYGIGPGKSYWFRHEGQRQKVVPAATATRVARALQGDFSESAKWAVETCSEMLFDDPTFEPIPVRDFFWDPFAANIDKARWAAHRVWRDSAYVKARFADPMAWNRVQPTSEELDDTGDSANRYRRSVQGQFDAQGMPVPNPAGRAGTTSTRSSSTTTAGRSSPS